MNVRNACFYSAQYVYTGGIENVVRRLHEIFPSRGVRLWLAMEHGKPDWASDDECCVLPKTNRELRETIWKEKLSAEKPEVVVFNHVDEFYIEEVKKDIRLIRSQGIKCIAVCHSSFAMPLFHEDEENWREQFIEWARECDLVASVSKYDVFWWRGIGLRSIYVRNPFMLPKKDIRIDTESTKGAINLLWVGRIVQPKQPKEALKVFAELVKQTENVQLTMVGANAYGKKLLEKEARRLGVAGKVTVVLEKKDISDLWAIADIHLLTSITETFCLALAEAKSHGVPTAMYELPFLELAESGLGIVTAPQGEARTLADRICEIVHDDKRRCKLGHEAKDSLKDFTDDSVWKSWLDVFKALENQEVGCEITPELRAIVYQEYHGWKTYCARDGWSVKMCTDWRKLTKTSLRPLASLLAFCRTIRHRIKGVA